ncbi:YHYH domain-containing protein [Cupriavidus sp. 2MCAB6]|uniref:YHYH domain-containing protein n=1 Tax=Cupriavidus sp. 2MCAB6 TaxID=3232981 RepID=UPI003F8F4E3D
MDVISARAPVLGRAGRKAVFRVGVGFVFALIAGSANAHGGGLDANGCHHNRKTGEYHCHRGPGSAGLTSTANATAPSGRPASASAFVSNRGVAAEPTCYTGPRGGTYTITASGRKNYGGC